MNKDTQPCPDMKEGQGGNSIEILLENSQLERLSWRNWILLSTVTIITTLGLITVIQSLLSERISQIWPWARTDLSLLVGLSLLVLSFIIYLTQHQRHIRKIREHLEDLRLERERHIEKQNSRLSAMCKVSGLVGKETDIEKVFDGITSICFETFQCHRASLMLADYETEELVVRSVKGFADKEIFNVRQGLGEGIAGWCAQHRQSLLLGSGTVDAEKFGFTLNRKNITSAMVVPIIVRDELVGVLNLSARNQEITYTDEDLKVVTVFAENAGTCIRHGQHTEWMRNLVRQVTDKKLQEYIDSYNRDKVKMSQK